jgi:hypothetical protein
MSLSDKVTDAFNTMQDYAASYFEIIHKTVFSFWMLPDVPTGGNILTGVFASLLIFLTRSQMSLPTDTESIGQLFSALLFYVVFICGVLVVFDPGVATRLDNMRRLISVVCVGITLGCGFIVVDRVLPWIGWVQDGTSAWGWGESGAHYLTAGAAAFAASTIIFANTLYLAPSTQAAIASPRVLIWSLICYGVIGLGIGLVITPPW